MHHFPHMPTLQKLPEGLISSHRADNLFILNSLFLPRSSLFPPSLVPTMRVSLDSSWFYPPSASLACQWVDMFEEDSQMRDGKSEMCEHVNSCYKSVLPRDNIKPLEAGTGINCVLELHDFLAS